MLMQRLWICLLLVPALGVAQKKAPVTAPDSTYGYTASNPMRLKQGEPYSSAALSAVFVRNLRTADNQPLELLIRYSIKDPAYSPPAIKIYDRQTGLPISGKLGLLDVYVLKTPAQDTIRLYVDIFHKGPRLIPQKLTYVGFE